MKNGYTVPCDYALLPNKHKQTRLFTQLKAWLEPEATLQFSHFLVDFEQGAYLAVVNLFPGVYVEGCFFHLCKRPDFHVKKLWLLARYQDDLEFKLRVKKLAAIVCLPLADVIDAYEVLADTFEFEDDGRLLLAYSSPTWIGAHVGRRGRRISLPSLLSCGTSTGVTSRGRLGPPTSNYLGTPEGSSSPASPSRPHLGPHSTR